MHISSAFDSGNIEVLELSPPNARLAIRLDAGEDHYQWFHFRVTGARGQALRLHIENAAGASYPGGWEGYQACYSYDRETWRRTSTRYEQGRLTIEHKPCADSVWFAYFAPFGHERHLDLVAQASAHPAVRYERLGATLDGRDLDLLQVGEGALPAWVIARQHPGESMAEWLMEGLIEALLDEADPVGRALLARWTFYLVPNMNPDGAARGHLRNNAAGANLNREWAEPSVERSPEVHLVRGRMESTGVGFFLDVHGDEALPYNFIAGAEGVPSWTAAAAERQAQFLQALLRASPDFQIEHGYPLAPPGRANLSMATPWVAERFGCLSMTLEQPFKDNADAPIPEFGWSPARARHLGRAVLAAMLGLDPA